ncbi:MAG: ABC transporter permease [Gemmatimonadetes bacterium]|nr:ABC transporter permease [Gemmatimonadota bacterium]
MARSTALMGLALARFAFDVPMRGSVLLIFGVAAIYLIAALGLGLWISTLVETQQQVMFITFFIVMVYLLMSGLFIPIRSMPVWAQWVAELSPVKHFIEIMRAVLLNGAGFEAILRTLSVLVVYAAAVFAFAVRQYAKISA